MPTLPAVKVSSWGDLDKMTSFDWVRSYLQKIQDPSGQLADNPTIRTVLNSVTCDTP